MKVLTKDQMGSVQKFGVTQTNFMFSMKSHTFIHQMSCKINRKYSQDIDEVRKNEFVKNNFVLQTYKLSSKNYPFAAITALQTFGILAVKKFHPTLPEAPPTSWIGLMGTSYVPYGQAAPTTAQ